MGKMRKRLLVMGIAVAAAGSILAGMLAMAGAVWSEDEAVHIDPDEIEDSTLAIGSHLIHLSALTDSIYEIAQTSADDSGQNRIYYKSELASGAWFDITNATTLTDITSGGTPVEKSIIAELFFTHHTMSDGITYDLRTGQQVYTYNIVDPYDLETLEELFPLKTQYDTIRETQSDSQAGQAKLARIEQILTMVVINDETIACDNALSALQSYYNVLSDNDGGASEMGIVQDVMDAVDANRRALVFETLEAALTEYAEELTYVTDTENEDGETVEGSAPDTTLQSAVNDSLQNVKNSLIEYQGKMLDPGTTVMSNVYYEFAEQLISDAEANNHAACDQDVSDLLDLQNIQNGNVAYVDSELALLDGTLVDRATSQYTDGLQAGVNATYNAAVADNSAQALLNNIINTNTSSLNTWRNELEFLITARSQRVGNEDAISYLDQRLELTYTWYGIIPADAFQAGAETTVDAHVEFLTDLRRQLEVAAGGNEMDALTAQKADLQTELMAALDNNDLALASEIEDQIAAVDDQIDALANESAAQIAQLNEQVSDLQSQLEQAQASGDSSLASSLQTQIAALNGQISSINAGMSSGTLGATVAELKSQAMEVASAAQPSSDEIANLERAVGSLSDLLSLDSSLVFPALKDIHAAMVSQRDLNGSSAFDSAIAAVEEAILNNSDAYAAAMRTDKNADDLSQIAEDFFSEDTAGTLLDPGSTGMDGAGTGDAAITTSLDDLGDNGEQAVYLAALQMYADETGSTEAMDLLDSTARRQLELGNPLVFLRVNDGGTEYLPLTALKAYTGMRYVWNQNRNLGTLARGGDYYGFTAYSDSVIRGKTEQDVDYMTTTAKYQNGIHVCETYTLEEFGVEALYLSGGSYGVLVSDEIISQAEQLFALFLS